MSIEFISVYVIKNVGGSITLITNLFVAYHNTAISSGCRVWRFLALW